MPLFRPGQPRYFQSLRAHFKAEFGRDAPRAKDWRLSAADGQPQLQRPSSLQTPHMILANRILVVHVHLGLAEPAQDMSSSVSLRELQDLASAQPLNVAGEAVDSPRYMPQYASHFDLNPLERSTPSTCCAACLPFLALFE